MGIRFQTPPTRTPVAGDINCPECRRPLEWERRERRDQVVQVHLRYSCGTIASRPASGRGPRRPIA